ncbi:MAG: CBS domain-containing protein [Caldilinea sp. CFX5]|nr:CBS domain-containing protein [Caldilinea sp. CFX5]
MQTVQQILNSKGTTVWSIAPNETVFTALKLMGEKEIGALTVVENGRLLGIVSERDYARKVILKGRTSRDTLVKEIMSAPAIITGMEQTVEQCMQVMTEKRIRHLPVLEEGRLVGIISIGDLVKTVIAEQQFLIEQLESYITQSPAYAVASVV